MRGYRKLLGSIGVATLLVGVTSVALASGPASFKTGTYKGKTSQGYKLAFVLSVIDDCVGDANGTPELCLSQSDSDEGYLALKCNTGGTSNNYIDMLAKVPASGVIRVTAYPDGKGSGLGRTVYYIQVHHNRTITGYVNDISIYPSAGNEKCVSGKVTFKARLG